MTGALRHAAGLLPGSALAGVVALAATFVAQLHGGPQLLYALFFGIAFHYLSQEARTKAGVEFCARQVLRLGVGLLGARITAAQIVALGGFTAAVVIAAVLGTLACGTLLARRFGMTRAQGVLSGGAVAICGASAALAIAAVLPRERHGDRFTLMVVISVTVMSTAAMVLYPLLARALSLPPELAGLFIGGTIHDVAQVVGAGYTLGTQTGDIATIVKLFRVALLAAVVLGVSLAFRAERERGEPVHAARQPLVPWFLWLFAVLVAVNSAGALPAALQQAMGWTSRACLVLAIAALGMKTSFMQLTQAGWRPIVLILVETVWMAALVLGAILWWR
ncbi:MAG: putative sulfate exporter family transporter [Piscinibacter sp.]|nr:putative sulfate exporter family transporter [Piscinibacter sp.]